MGGGGSAGPQQQQIALAAAGATALVAAGAVLAYTKTGKPHANAKAIVSETHHSIVVFVQGGDGAPLGKTIRYPRRGPVSDLICTISALLNLATPR
jgi:uncharacterized RmlC-like cupin family protein